LGAKGNFSGRSWDGCKKTRKTRKKKRTHGKGGQKSSAPEVSGEKWQEICNQKRPCMNNKEERWEEGGFGLKGLPKNVRWKR